MDGAWPARSLAECEAMLTAPGQMFETADVTIAGRTVRTWRNLPPTLSALLAMVAPFGHAEAFVLGEERVSFTAFRRAVAALAEALAARGVGQGDRVAIAMRNLPEFPVAFFAAAAVGAIAVPLNSWWRGAELDYALGDCCARLLICDGELARRIDRRALDLIVTRGAGGTAMDALIGAPVGWAALPDRPLPVVGIGPETPGALFYTSGTTGEPKGAVLSHRNMLTAIGTGGYSAARAILRRGDLPPAEPPPNAALQTIPFFHVTGWCAFVLPALAMGAKLVMMHKWDALEAMRLIQDERITLTGGVPTIAWQLIEHPERHRFDLSSLKAMSYGGAPAAAELVETIDRELRTEPGTGWGMTETSATVTHHYAEDYLARPDSCGPPPPVARLKIMSADGSRELPAGEVGELWATGPMIAQGYWNKPEASAETFVDGWVRSGDLARLDAEGFCYIVDRAKDVIIRGGENIYPSEIENALYEFPGVTDAAVVGVAHRTLGEEPAAVVHLAPGAEADEAGLRAWVAARLAAFKVPVRILFSEATLPRNANGKIMKRELRDWFV